jgi:hypothetical protein
MPGAATRAYSQKSLATEEALQRGLKAASGMLACLALQAHWQTAVTGRVLGVVGRGGL